MRRYIFIIFLAGVCFGIEKSKLEQSQIDWIENAAELAEKHKLLGYNIKDINSMNETLLSLGDEIEIDIANNVEINILSMTYNIVSMNTLLLIFSEIADVHLSTKERLCLDNIEEIMKRTLPALLHQTKELKIEINAGINLLNGLATISKNIQLVSVINDAKKTYREILIILG